jgi:putative transposase
MLAAMPRTARIAPGGVVFHVLNRGNARNRIFDDDGDYLAFLRVLSAALAAVPGMRLLSYCLMPNHWHLVLWPRGDGELGRFMQRLTVTHVRRWHEHRHSTGGGHLYQGTYKSFPVQRDEHLLVVCRYVERNALRAGLVRRAQDWRWCSLWQRLYDHQRAVPNDGGGDNDRDGNDHDAPAGNDSPGYDPPTLGDWPVEIPVDWLRWVNRAETATEAEAVRQSIRRGRPFGTPAWQKRTARRLGLESAFRPRGRPPKGRE